MKAIALSVAVALAGTAGGAWAQQQACARAASPAGLYEAALAAINVVDAQQAGRLWREASAVTHAAVSEQAFVDTVRSARSPLGQLQRRDWSSVAVMDVDARQGDVAPGHYASINFHTRFAAGEANELVSFRRDEDCRWRFSGYTVTPLG